MRERRISPLQPLAPISENDVARLPASVQRFLRFSGVIGKIPAQTVSLKQTGRMRTSRDGSWRALTAEQYYTVNPSAFVWYGAFDVGIGTIEGLDIYGQGKGRLQIRFSPWKDIALFDGPQADISEFIRYFSEMVWFPTALLDPRIRWEEVDANRARASMQDHENRTSALLTFADNGSITSWETDDRYALIDGKTMKARWALTVTPNDYLETEGYRIMRNGAATWKLQDGDYRYIEVTLTEVKYDPVL